MSPKALYGCSAFVGYRLLRPNSDLWPIAC